MFIEFGLVEWFCFLYVICNFWGGILCLFVLIIMCFLFSNLFVCEVVRVFYNEKDMI